MRKILLLCLTLFCNYTFSQYFNTQARVVTFNGEVNLLQNGKYFLLDKQVVTVKLSDNNVMPSNINIVRVNGLGYYDIKIPNNVNYEDYMNHLKSLRIFSVIEYNAMGKYNGKTESNDKEFANQWYLSRIKVLNAWDTTFGEESIKVGVLDSGLDWTHKDIGLGKDSYQNVYLNYREDLWKDSNNPNTGDSQDNDKNGFIDDLKGWNFSNKSNDVRTRNSHGTQVTGIISAKTNNLEGISGIAGGKGKKGVQIIPVCVGVSSPESAIIDDAIIYAVDSGVRIIQLSLSVIQTDAIEKAIEYATQKGVLVICASGNNYKGELSYPASNRNVVAVGGTDKRDKRASFANYGHNLSVVAPAVDIYSTSLDDQYHSSDGTSFAAPQVSAVAALILSVNLSLTGKEVRDIIEKTAQKVGSYNYQNRGDKPNGSWNNEMGYGLVDAYEAVKKAKALTLPRPELISSSELWGFCRKATFKITNLPEDAKVDWQYPRGSKVLRELGNNEIEIDFGTNHRAIVKAIVTSYEYGNTTLEYRNTNNSYIRNDYLRLNVLENVRTGKHQIEFWLDEENKLTEYQRSKLTIINTNNCTHRTIGGKDFIEITGDNPSISVNINYAPEPCEDEVATFKIIMGSSLIKTEESKIAETSPSVVVDGCTTTMPLNGEIYVYRWQGARHVYIDFEERYYPMSEEEKYNRLDWGKNAPSISKKVRNGYFECVPVDETFTYMHPLHIDVLSGEVHYNSPRYAGFLDWGKVWVRFVTSCRVSKWELIDFSKITFVTNGYFVSRDKGYQPGGVFRVTPNPASDNVLLSIFNSEQGKRGFRLASSQSMNENVETPYGVRVYNSAGVLVRSFEGKGNSAWFSVKGLPSGIYIVHFSQGGNTHKEKLIVE
ncbi:S8 family peptidase [Capnocytophaga cynodegmi]|uniref:S8 family peptidase n=1 Tax=Capnocytophaga cynodegmi TaxID=28189 RepID=UPI00385C9DBF